MKTVIIGAKGEVGSALANVLLSYNPLLVDIRNVITGVENVDIMQVCIPWSDSFVEVVKKYQEHFQPKYTVIHSTVPVGTSRLLDAIHSPIRGVHPFLEDGIRTFPKFISGDGASDVADYFRRAGLKVILCDKQETTELGKLLDTEYFRACIEFTKKAKVLSYKYDVPFHEAFTLFNLTYNEGYTELGHKEYVRPTLQPIMTPIGGHCVEKNKELLDA